EVYHEERRLERHAKKQPRARKRTRGHRAQHRRRRLGEVADRLHPLREQDVTGAADQDSDQDEHEGLQHQNDFPIAASTSRSTAASGVGTGSSAFIQRTRSRLNTMRFTVIVVRFAPSAFTWTRNRWRMPLA